MIIKPFAKNEKVMEALIRALGIYCQDIEIEFGIENVPCL